MAKKLSVKRVDGADEAAWETLAAHHGCLFDSGRWAVVHGSALQRIGIYGPNGELRGGFCLCEQQRWGFRILRNPPFTPHVGPFFDYSATNAAAQTDEHREVMAGMADYLDRTEVPLISIKLGYDVRDCLPFLWRGFKVAPHYTYRIDLSLSEETLLGRMLAQHRNSIKKARKEGVTAVEVNDSEDLRLLVARTFERQKKSYPRERMEAVLGVFPPGSGSFCFISRWQGKPVAGVYVVHDSQTAFNLMTGYDHERTHHGAGALAMWSAILKAKELGLKVFDFEGSIIPPIEAYFRRFGGVLSPYFSVHKA